MFHKAVKLEFGPGTNIDVTFQTGEVKRFNVAGLFDKYPEMKALQDRVLFTSGKLMGFYGIIWNEDLDLEVESVYEDGVLLRKEQLPANPEIGAAVLKARANAGMSQTELAVLTHMDQSDISKIERGVSNPSVATLKRIANALDSELQVSFKVAEPNPYSSSS